MGLGHAFANCNRDSVPRHDFGLLNLKPQSQAVQIPDPFPFPATRIINLSIYPHEESVSLRSDLLPGVVLATMLIPPSVSYKTALAKLSLATG